jgi:hypothetical protein
MNIDIERYHDSCEKLHFFLARYGKRFYDRLRESCFGYKGHYYKTSYSTDGWYVWEVSGDEVLESI